MSNRITAWSYSLYNIWKECPFRAKCRAVTRVKTVSKPKPALERGIAIHKLAEHYLLGDIKGMPKELNKFAEEFRNLKKLGAPPEVDIAVTKDWKPSKFNDWNNVWCRAQLDTKVYTTEDQTLTLIDFKTGQMYASNDEQLELYAPLAAAHHPFAQRIEVELWYLDSGEVPPSKVYLRSGFNAIRKKWEAKVRPMMRDTIFPATPSDNACKWCPYKDLDGGPCKEWRNA